MTETNPQYVKPKVVYRQLAIEVEAFDRLKEWQRHHLALTGRLLSNSQIVSRVLKNNPAPNL